MKLPASLFLILLMACAGQDDQVKTDQEKSGTKDSDDAPLTEAAKPTLILVVGASGTEEFGQSFRKWADNWQNVADREQITTHRIDGASESKTAHDRLRETIAALPPKSPLWLVLIGHGTFDQRNARFNLVGPDVTAKQLAGWLAASARPTAIINCASSSAPFINRLSGPKRIIITATKNGAEHNFARFGRYLSEAIGDDGVDLDKDGQTSLLEAWLIAARRTQDFYLDQGRLATEHALIDDNGDERGTRFDAFRGIRPVAGSNRGQLDGHYAHQWHLIPGDLERRMPAALVAERNKLELAIARLRNNKSSLDKAEYYQQLETLLVPLATLYEEASAKPPAAPQR